MIFSIRLFPQFLVKWVALKFRKSHTITSSVMQALTYPLQDLLDRTLLPERSVRHPFLPAARRVIFTRKRIKSLIWCKTFNQRNPTNTPYLIIVALESLFGDVELALLAFEDTIDARSLQEKESEEIIMLSVYHEKKSAETMLWWSKRYPSPDG